MHTEVTIKTAEDKQFTIMYDGVIRIECSKSHQYLNIHLKDNHTVRCMNKYWFEYNLSRTPDIHIYNKDIVSSLFVSEV